jgi:hypothetical protein
VIAVSGKENLMGYLQHLGAIGLKKRLGKRSYRKGVIETTMGQYHHTLVEIYYHTFKRCKLKANNENTVQDWSVLKI